VAALASALAAAPAAFAQDTKVGEVIITAQKRSENLQDVPVSVAAIGGEKLQATFAAGDDILALSAKAPGLYAESSNGRVAPRFYIRGLGNADFDLAASQPVSIIQDDVVLENVVLKSSPLYDLDHVEVLRGPQGTLFGRNTTAGIVKFDTIKPSEVQKGRASASYGSYNTFTFDGGVGGALVEGKVAARASFLFQHRDDWIDNAFTKKENALGGFDEKAARLQLLFTPTEKLSRPVQCPRSRPGRHRRRVPRQHADQGLEQAQRQLRPQQGRLRQQAATTRRSTTAWGFGQHRLRLRRVPS
jgi:iron complex outermembrane receptor protein